jgi:sterol desaturase/sphingolipid hydroxylase (fatty acid hydroxylase superfamily)
MQIIGKYFLWLVIISVTVFTLERIVPWRKGQKILRKGFFQDVFWLVFNGRFLGFILAIITAKLIQALNGYLYNLGLPVPASLNLIQGMPLWQQFIIFFIIKDFIEWNIHRLLHIVPLFWEFHKLHHSIETMDWIGNMRFHWGEVIVYKSLSYLPLAVFGVDGSVLFTIAIVNTLIGHLNHSNLAISWGPLRYLINSPKMHIWHHDVISRSKGGQNFGITLSVWDWIFGTAYMPDDKEIPDKIGFDEINKYPQNIVARFFYPFYKWIPVTVLQEEKRNK